MFRKSDSVRCQSKVFMCQIEGSLETKVPTIWAHEKHNQEEAEPGRNSDVEKVRREKIRDGESQKREDAGVQKDGKFAKHCVFQCFVAQEGQKVGSLKRRLRSQLARCKMKKCTPLWREARLEVKMYKTPQLRRAFRS